MPDRITTQSGRKAGPDSCVGQCAPTVESFPGFVTGIEFSDGRPRKCGNCDDCCPCYDVTDVKSAGIYVTIRLGDDAARIRFGPATLSYGAIAEREDER